MNLSGRRSILDWQRREGTTTREIHRPGSDLRITLGPNHEGLVAIAQDVAIQRGAMVTETLFHIAAIRSLQNVSADGANAVIECRAARVQDTTARDGQQAAHLLPGQIYVNSSPVWMLAGPPRNGSCDAHELARLRLQTMECFAKTSVLPAIFNRADSQAERMAGSKDLKTLFGDAVKQIWTRARVDPKRPLAIDRLAVVHALKTWFGSVNHLYRVAASRKEEKWAQTSAAEREAEMKILNEYASSFSVVNIERFLHSHAPHLRDVASL